MEKIIMQLLMATAGTLGFAMIFNLPRKYIFMSCLGGLLSWAVYLICIHFGLTVFGSTLIASVAAGLYSEVMSEYRKAPATLFMISALIPLIPGSNLYYTFSAIVQKSLAEFNRNGNLTLEYVFGIAVGICAALMLSKVIRSFHRR